MKKIIAITLFALLPFLTFSQNKFGLFGGLNISNLSDGFLEKVPVGKSFGPHIGGLYQYNFNKKIAFRPKLVLSFQGDREGTNDPYSGAGTIDYKLTYVNIPVNFKFFSQPYIIAGPQMGFLVSTEKGERDYGEVETFFDYGLNFGLGYDIKNFFLEINLYQGIPTLITIDQNTSRSVVDVDATNTVFQMTFGYLF